MFELKKKNIPTPRLYIAYGSNMNLKQMEHRCPTATIVGSAEVKDYQLLFRGGRNAVATIEPSEGASVPVLVWDLEKNDESALDRYEGWPHFYHKEAMEVELNGEPTEVMVYVMNDGYPAGMPSKTYFNTILEGYDDSGFDTSVLTKALEHTTDLMNQETAQQMKQDVEQDGQLGLDMDWW